jgi:hypothetical protein
VSWKQLLREPNIWIGVAIAVIVIPILIYAIIKHERGDVLEADWQTVSVSQGRVALHPRYHHDNCLWTAVADDTTDAGLLNRAVKLWNDRICNEELGCRYLCTREDPELFSRTSEKSGARFSHIFVSTETLPNTGEGGITNNIYDKATGEAYYAIIKINKSHTYHEDSYLAALVHELGHGLLLGHCDDRHKTSIMRKTLNVRGTITDHDAELLREAWITNKLSR